MKTPTRTEPILDVAHLGHVELLTPRPAESVWYFTEVRRGAGVYWGSALPESFLEYVTPNATGAEVPVSRYKGPIFDPQ